MEKCVDCLKWLSEYGKDVFCDACPSGRPDNKIAVYVKETVVVGNGYKTTKSRIDELERRVILPYKGKEKGDYYVGRLGENGKVQEREPTY